MILTCPECSTKYVVKDGAIPEGGRQVRCAACKHSWHQDPEPAGEEQQAAGGAIEHPVDVLTTAGAGSAEPPLPEPGPAQAPLPPVEQGTADDDRRWDSVDTGPEWSDSAPAETAEPQDFEPFTMEEHDAPPRRAWPLVLTALLLAALAAVAFWFLAPADVKARIGLASAGGTPLQVMGLSQDRQRLASGNDLFTVSGRIVNPTDESQRVPPLQAELLADNKQTVLYRWTIAPPADTLPAGDSRSFHSAEMGVPEGGKYLRLRLVTAGG